MCVTYLSVLFRLLSEQYCVFLQWQQQHLKLLDQHEVVMIYAGKLSRRDMLMSTKVVVYTYAHASLANFDSAVFFHFCNPVKSVVVVVVVF